ncbi:uncharacterized protein MELLADRAFT_110286 [Melampsora larici-populina 98AG31]|uniref:Uncharacterized protein n=1 Tax=Melampsora larici-populina (strain 98AG31 / pathotype 3-4-7) TaxID=747676 RepID=F4RZA0_MELLP|nr:uncharacterized protein MELLADRAFT_110286 [Melampsora larici-populina 98AG31]EGG02187.1 hypothetical protein MELLADRAFT_110286 [Melampsora larici-populina 98AG31]
MSRLQKAESMERCNISAVGILDNLRTSEKALNPRHKVLLKILGKCNPSLCLDQIFFFPEAKYQALQKHYGSREYARLDFEYQHKESASIFMENAADIILLCGSYLRDLKLKFTESVGFSDHMIDSIRHIKNLKKLIIEGARDPCIVNDSQSLAEVLSSVISLESLSLKFASLEVMCLDAGCLPNLVHFWIFNHPNNYNAIINFISTEGRKIKVLECMPMLIGDESIKLFEVLKESLEGIFVSGIPDDIREDLRLVEFSNLRFIQIRYMDDLYDFPTWLEWPIFKNVELFIMNYKDSRNYWKETLIGLRKTKIITPPNLKHFVFITGRKNHEKDTSFVNGFKRHGISCHFKSNLEYTEALEILATLKNQEY